jgi:uncharacterized phage-like protein YoqJ
MKIAFLGHKIQDLGGFESNKIQEQIQVAIETVIKKNPKYVVLTSLSLGIEMWAAQIARENNAPYHVYIPFTDYHAKWPFATRKEYTELLKHASKKITLDSGGYDVKKLIAKDVAILEEADIIYSFFKSETKLLQKYSDKVQNILPVGEQDDYFITI